MKCPFCGKEVFPGDAFCMECGKPLTGLSESPVFQPQGEPVYEQPTYEQPTYEQPQGEPVYEQPAYEQPAYEQPQGEPVYEQPTYEQPTYEQPQGEPVYEQPTYEQPAYEQPQGEPVYEPGMLICTNPACGKPIPAGSRFCEACGTPVAGAEPVRIVPPANDRVVTNNGPAYQQGGYQQTVTQVNNGSQPGRTIPQQPARGTQQRPMAPQVDPEKLKKRNRIIGIVIGAALLVCVVIAAMSAFIKPTINLNKYMSVSFSGYDTVGTASATFDMGQFEKDNEKLLAKALKKYSKKKTSDSSSSNVDYDSFFYDMDPGTASSQFLSECVNGSFDKESGLSNGDTVTFAFLCKDTQALENYGFKLKYSDITQEVTGLKEAETFDLFAGIDVVFDGIAPNGSATITGSPTATEAQNFNYNLDKYNQLNNGDTVTLTASMYYNEDPYDYCLQQYGKIPAELTRTYTVSGINSYVTKRSEITDECLEQMKSQAEDVLMSKEADFDETETLQGYTYIGDYLLVSKTDDRSDRNNFYLVYKVQVRDKYSTNADSYDKVNTYYWYINYPNVLVNPEGENAVDLTYYNQAGSNARFNTDVGWGYTWYYDGYNTLDDLYKDVVTSRLDAYTHEDNVDENNPGGATTVKEGTDAASDSSEEVSESEEDDGMIFPDSSDKVIDEKEIKALSDDDLQNAINELYARKGYIFKDDTLREYYEQYDWYEETVKPDKFTMDLFNSTEKTNIEALQKERDAR